MADICTTCLSRDTTLSPIGQEQLQILNKLCYPKTLVLNNRIVKLCSQCDANLQDVNAFRTKALASLDCLNQIWNNAQNPTLKISSNTIPVQKSTEENSLGNIKIESAREVLDEEEIDIKCEVGHEEDVLRNVKAEGTDSEPDVSANNPGSFIEVVAGKGSISIDGTQNGSKRNVAVKEKRKTKCKKLWHTVMLDESEMLAVMEQNRQKPSFLEAKVKCHSCAIVLPNKSMLTVHNNTFHNEAIGSFVCTICQSRYSEKRKLTGHRTLHTNTAYVCVCGYKRYCKREIMVHRCADNSKKKSSEARVHGCKYCGKTFKSRGNIFQHVQLKHRELPRVQCDVCKRTLKNIFSLRQHMKIQHSDGLKPATSADNYCKLCDIWFNSKWTYRMHVKMSGSHADNKDKFKQRSQAEEVLENVDIEMVDLRDVKLENAQASTPSRLLFISPNLTPTDLFMPIRNHDKATPVQDAAADVELDSDDEPRDNNGVPTFDELRIVLDRNEGSDFGEDVEEELQRNTEYGAGNKSGVASNSADFPDGAIPEDVEVLRDIDRRDDLYLRNLTAEEKLVFDWHEDPNVFKGVKEVFTGRVGPTFELEEDVTPLALLEKIWDSDILKLIIEQTNLYAEQSLKKPGVKLHSRNKKWKPVTANDIWLFFAVLILQSLDSRHDETEYWYSNLECLDMPNFKKIMPYKKYVLIKKFLHFVNNETLIPRFDKAAKIKPIIDHLNKKFEGLYLPAQEIVLDESLLLWKGRLNMVQKISIKAAGVGLKTYELCESNTGYLWSFRLYTGKDDKPTNADSTREAGSIEHSSNELVLNVPEPDPTKADEPDSKKSTIVFDLVRPLLGKGHVLYMDNSYNSPLLSRLLKIQNTDTVGTLRKNREFVPDALKQTEKSDLRVGEIAFSVTSDITVTLWRDSNLIAFISTMHPIKIVGKEKFGKYKCKPQVVYDYNLHMGGVDKKDQLLSAFPMERSRNLFWYKKVFRRLVNTSILNSWIIMNTKKKMAHRAFREQLVKLIVLKTQPPVSTVVNVNPKANRPQLVGGHYCVKGTKKRAVCKLCTMRGIQDKRTSRECDVCKIPLCLDPCFKDYHTKVSPSLQSVNE